MAAAVPGAKAGSRATTGALAADTLVVHTGCRWGALIVFAAAPLIREVFIRYAVAVVIETVTAFGHRARLLSGTDDRLSVGIAGQQASGHAAVVLTVRAIHPNAQGLIRVAVTVIVVVIAAFNARSALRPLTELTGTESTLTFAGDLLVA